LIIDSVNLSQWFYGTATVQIYSQLHFEIKLFLSASKFCTVSKLLRLELRGIQSKFLRLGSGKGWFRSWDDVPKINQVTMKAFQRIGANG